MSRSRLGLLTGSALLASAVCLPAHAGEEHAATPSFSGSCQFTATVAFAPAQTGTPAPGTDRAQGQGTCSGTLTTASGLQRQIDNAPAEYWAADSGTSSCEAATMAGSGQIVIERTSQFGFVLHESRVGPVAMLIMQGTRSGAALGEANLPPNENPQAVASACLSGGLLTAPVDITVRTARSVS